MGTGVSLSPFLGNKSTHDMKKIFKTIASVTCATSIILAGCENMDGSLNSRWTLAWMALAVVSGLIFNRLDREQSETN